LRRSRNATSLRSPTLAEAYVQPEFAWPRLIFDGEQLVGFVMAGFKPGDPLLDSTIWRLNVAGTAQRRGYGRFAVQEVARVAKRRKRTILTTSYLKGEASPEGFYRRLGFEPTGRRIGEIFEAVATVEKLLVL
jgi:diamine N-acetyltransferase